MTLKEFLERWPWAAERPAPAKTMDWLWSWELSVDALRLWPYLADTSAFNKRLGLGEMRFTEREGRLHGSSGGPGLRLEWVESPWEWEYGKGLSNTRTYSKGFARFVRARYVLEEAGPGKTLLHVYFGWIPRGLSGRLLLAASEGWIRRRYGEELARVVEAAAQDAPLPAAGPTPSLSPDSAARLASAEAALIAEGCDPSSTRALMRHLAEAPEEDLLQLKVRRLARAWGVDFKILLKAVLHATRRGVLVLSWDVVCPHCRGARLKVQTLGDVPAEAECGPCGIDFAATGLNALEATFHIHPAVRKASPRMYCAAEPATKPHIVLQRVVAPRSTQTVCTVLPAGRFRLRVQGEKRYTLLDLGTRASIDLKNDGDEERTFVLEASALDADALRPADLFSFQDFRDLFSEESVGQDIQLEIGFQTIIFTDVIGSTKFYEEVGDPAAFAQVRRHFIKVFEVIRRHEGAVVKTIGDAALGAFERPANAMRAAIELQQWFNDRNQETPLRIRISMHSGPCLAVNLNSNIDYFGGTVNLAAKMQTAVEAQQILYTEVVAADPDTQRSVAALSVKPETIDFPLKWSGGRMTAFRLTLP